MLSIPANLRFEGAPTCFVGVDPSITNSGVVVMDHLGRVRGCLNSKLREKTCNLQNDDILRLKEIADYIVSGIQALIPPGSRVVVGYETYAIDAINRPYTIGEMGGVLKLSLLMAGFELLLVEPLRLKLFATGRGTASKEALSTQAQLEEPLLSELAATDLTYDVTDAYFLAKWAFYMDSPRLAIAHEIYRTNLRRRLEQCQKLKKQMEQKSKKKTQKKAPAKSRPNTRKSQLKEPSCSLILQ